MNIQAKKIIEIFRNKLMIIPISIILFLSILLIILSLKKPHYLDSHIDKSIPPEKKVYSYDKNMYMYETDPGGFGTFKIVKTVSEKIVKHIMVHRHIVTSTKDNRPKAIAWSYDNKKIAIIYHYDFLWCCKEYQDYYTNSYTKCRSQPFITYYNLNFKNKNFQYHNYSVKDKSIDTCIREIRGHVALIDLNENNILYYQINRFYHKILFSNDNTGFIFKKPDNRTELLYR